MSDTMLQALARERDGYAARGLEDRVAAVEEQIAALEGRPKRRRSRKAPAG